MGMALDQAVLTGSKSSCVRSRGASAGCKLQRISLLLLAHGRRRCRRCAVDSSCTSLSTHRVPALRLQARYSGVSAAGRAVHCPCFKMAGAAEPTAAQAAAYIQNNVTQAQSLLPWISVAAGAVLGGAVAGCGHMQTAAPPCTFFACGLHHFRKLSALQSRLQMGRPRQSWQATLRRPSASHSRPLWAAHTAVRVAAPCFPASAPIAWLLGDQPCPADCAALDHCTELRLPFRTVGERRAGPFRTAGGTAGSGRPGCRPASCRRTRPGDAGQPAEPVPHATQEDALGSAGQAGGWVVCSAVSAVQGLEAHCGGAFEPI